MLREPSLGAVRGEEKMATQATAQLKSVPITMWTSPPQSAPTHDEIAVLAYSLWQAQGCPIGTAEEDWLTAEASLKEKAGNAFHYFQ